MNLNFSVEPGELFLDEAAVLVVELAWRLQDRCGNVVCPNILKMSIELIISGFNGKIKQSC